MDNDIKVVVRIDREWFRQAVEGSKIIMVSMLPDGARAMLKDRKRITLTTGAPEPTMEEMLDYIEYRMDEPHRTDLRVECVARGAGAAHIINRIAAIKGMEPYDVAQDVCVGVPLSDVEFWQRIEDARKNGVSTIDPRALIITAMPIQDD